jgi:hypothetical protein
MEVWEIFLVAKMDMDMDLDLGTITNRKTREWGVRQCGRIRMLTVHK